MTEKNIDTSDEKRRQLIDAIKEANPDLANEVDSYITSLNEKQKDTEAKLTEKTHESERLKLFSDISTQSAIVLERDADSTNELLTWRIVKANPATAEIFETEPDGCIGHKLSDFMEASYDITLPDNIDESYADAVELDAPNIDKHLVLYIHGRHSNNNIICSIADQTETYTLRNQLNTHLQRFELITESLITLNSHNAYSETFTLVLDRLGFHLSPKRALIIIDNGKDVGELKYQWNATNTKPIPQDATIEYKDCPSWRKMLIERKMILGFQLKKLPEDIANQLSRFGMNNAYIFPLNVTNEELYGSLIIETPEYKTIDNFDINYIKIISILLSGHIMRKLIADDLIKEKERAEESDRLKSSFLVNMSHDIRIPVNSILGFSDLLADEDITQTDREEFIYMITKSGQDLVTLIDNIIDISEIETGQMKVKKVDCQLQPLLENIIGMYKHDQKLAESEDLTLQLDLPTKFHDIHIVTDNFRFKQICTNLIDNALKFTNSGTVKLGISNIKDNMIEFYVQDTGIGIAEKEQAMIFQRFSKVDRSFAKEYNGTGLGLSICKSLIEMLGGEIHVVSVLGKGSTFYFTHPLPIANSNDVINASHETKSPYNWSKRSIVIVDDIEQDKKYLNYILSSTGIDIVWFNNGEEAIRFFESGNMADIMLVEMTHSAMEAARKIHSEFPVPIIAQSQDNKTDSDRTLAMKSGCAAFISKPLNVPSFLNTIDKTFNKI